MAFKSFKSLQLPLEIAMCNLNTAAISTGEPSNCAGESLLDDLVPASVSKLSWLSVGNDQHGRVLEAMFLDFAARKSSIVPALRRITLSYPEDASDAYKDQCKKLLENADGIDIEWVLIDEFYMRRAAQPDFLS